MRSKLFVLLSIISASALCANPPAELAKLLADLHKEISGAEQVVEKEYLAALRELQNGLASKGDLEGAIAAKRELERVMAKKDAPLPVARRKKSSVVGDTAFLAPADAKTSGSIKYDDKRDLLIDFSKRGSMARWKLSGINPGVYSANITFKAGTREGGVISVRSFYGKGRVSINGGSDWSVPQTLLVNGINLPEKQDILTLEIASYQSESFARIHSIELKRTGAPLPKTDEDGNPIKPRDDGEGLFDF